MHGLWFDADPLPEDPTISIRPRVSCKDDPSLNKLLQSVLHAHGGLELWSRFSDLITDVEMHGQPRIPHRWNSACRRARILMSLHSQRTIVHLPSNQGTLMLQPGMATLYSHGCYESLNPPKSLLSRNTPVESDALRIAYFMGTAVRQLVTAPFAYISPSVTAHEVEPRENSGEIWRRLTLRFASDLELPTDQQTAYYGPDGLLRRLRYRIDALDGIELDQRITSYETVDGIRLPSSVELYLRTPMSKENAGSEHLGEVQLRNTLLLDPRNDEGFPEHRTS